MNLSDAALLASVPLLLLAGAIWLVAGSGESAPPSGSVTAPRRGKLAQIRVVSGVLTGTEAAVTEKLVVGRNRQAQLIFPDDQSDISRRHCSIAFDRSALVFQVCDLGSKNGTFVVDGDNPPSRLPANVATRIRPGAQLWIGSPLNRLVLELA